MHSIPLLTTRFTKIRVEGLLYLVSHVMIIMPFIIQKFYLSSAVMQFY